MTTRTLSSSLVLFLPLLTAAQRFDWSDFTQVLGSEAGTANSVCLDPSGDVIIAGTYSVDVVSGDDTIHPYFPGNGTDIYVAKFQPDGTPVWITGFGGSWYDDAYSVRTDDVGNIYVSGHIQGGTTVFEDTVVTNLTEEAIMKLDPDGGFVWDHFHPAGQRTDLAVIHHSIYYTTSSNCIGKLDSDGNPVWQLTPSTGLGNNSLNTLIASPQDQLIAISPNGFGAVTITYDTLQIDLPTANHGYYVRLDTNGIVTGSAVFGPENNSWVHRIPAAVDANGNIYLASNFTDSITLGPTTLYSHGLNAFGFLACFSSADQPVWADSIPSEYPDLNGITFDPSLQKVFLAGTYSHSTDLGNGMVLPSMFFAEGFIATFAAGTGTVQAADHWGSVDPDQGAELAGDGNGIVFGCGSVGGALPTTFRCRNYANGNSGVLFQYSQGSDAIAQVQITSDGTTLTAAPSAASMQWFLNGDTIPGATSNTLPLGAAGTYSVVATNEYGCSSTDQFIFDDIVELSNAGLTVYPVPAADMLWIQVPTQQAPCTIDLYNATGARSLSLRCGPGSNALDVSDLAEGVYLLRSSSAAIRVVVRRQ